jgi:hypothetical protein
MLGTGSPNDLFGQYEQFFQSALVMFWKSHVPCEFRTPEGRCINVASAHTKGHQSLTGNILDGEFISSFSVDVYLPTWCEDIREAVRDISLHLQERIERDTGGATEERHFLKKHSENTERLFQKVGNADEYQSHSTCFCCLMRVPYHALPCGHVLCTRCIKDYGQPTNQGDNRFVYRMDFCPLHEQQTRRKWQGPCIVRFKPDHAGIRILCLDR